MALVLVGVIVAYSPALDGGFIWDDDAHVTAPELRSWEGLYRIWFEVGATQQYYPLLHSAFWIEHRAWGDATQGYHMLNLVQHMAAIWVLLLILRRLQVPGALLAAAIFALHPVMTESVAWITEQKNTLSAVFYLAGFLAYLNFDEKRRSSSYGWASALYVLGLLTKTVTATLPAALLVVFWWQRGRLSWRRDVWPLIPWFVLGLIAGLFTAWIERTQIGAVGATFQLTLVQRGLLAGRVIWFYLASLLWPTNLMFIYPRWHINPAVWWQWLFPLASLALTLGLWLLRKKWRAPLAGWLFFVGTLFPVLGFFNVYPFVFSFVADHFQYLASLGIIVPLSAGLVLATKRLAQFPSLAHWRQQVREIGGVLCLCLVATLGAVTWHQSRMYSDAITLYQTTIDKNPSCWMPYNNLGAVLIKRGHPQDAIEKLQKAVEIKPDYAQAFDNLGLAFVALNKLQDAAKYHQQAVLLNPRNAEFHDNLGIVLGRLGKPQEAVDQFQNAININPNFANALANLGSAFTQTKQPHEALQQLQLALKLEPDLALAYMNSAIAYDQLDSTEQALAAAEKALELAKTQGQTALVQRISQWLANYRLKKTRGQHEPPWTEPLK